MVNSELSRTHLHSVHTFWVPCAAQWETAKGEVMILRHFCRQRRISKQIPLACYLGIHRLYFPEYEPEFIFTDVLQAFISTGLRSMLLITACDTLEGQDMNLHRI